MTVVPTAAHDWAATESLLDSLLPASEQQRHLIRLPAGTIIHRYGSTCRGILFVKEGTIEVSLPGKDGDENTVFQVGPGGAVGLTAAIARGQHEFTAHVVDPVVGYFIPVDMLREWLVANPANYVLVAQMLSDWNDKIFSIRRSGQPHKALGKTSARLRSTKSTRKTRKTP
jgi:CRP-like cAMP-binding protein